MTEPQTAIVLAHLRRGPLTPLAALREYGIMRLGARVWDLKRKGHLIATDRVKLGRKCFASYRLVKGRAA